MARVIVGMTTSLDGFVADESGSVDRLYRDLAALHGTTYMYRRESRRSRTSI